MHLLACCHQRGAATQDSSVCLAKFNWQVASCPASRAPTNRRVGRLARWDAFPSGGPRLVAVFVKLTSAQAMGRLPALEATALPHFPLPQRDDTCGGPSMADYLTTAPEASVWHRYPFLNESLCLQDTPLFTQASAHDPRGTLRWLRVELGPCCDSAAA